MSGPLIRVQSLRKVFRQGFWMRRVEAVQGVSFDVQSGDIVGFLGPNGAGKTTTIKMLTGLIRPTSGTAELFGHAVPSRLAMTKTGFLPENPYVYPFLSPREFVEMCGGLSGLSGRALRARTEAVLDQVGILYAADRQVRKLSKGMLQRAGLAAALVGDPELLILDEPMSGLDPVGRKEVRDIILDERRRGRTIFFSTHILTDVESLCDKVTILRKGRVVISGKLRDLLRHDVQITEVTLANCSEAWVDDLAAPGVSVERLRDLVVVTVEGAANVDTLLADALDNGAHVRAVTPRHETLEDVFVREAIRPGDDQPA